MFTLNVELFWSLFVFGIRVRGPGRFCRSSSFFFHWPAELLTSFVKHHRSDVQKKQDDTRQSSNGLQSRSPSTCVITELQISLDLRNINLPGNKPDVPASYCCRFPLVFPLPVKLCREMKGFMPEDHWSRNECPVRFSERLTGGVWRTKWGVPPVSEGKP